MCSRPPRSGSGPQLPPRQPSTLELCQTRGSCRGPTAILPRGVRSQSSAGKQLSSSGKRQFRRASVPGKHDLPASFPPLRKVKKMGPFKSGLMPDPAERRCNPLQSRRLEGMQLMCRRTTDHLRKQPLRGGSELRQRMFPPRPRLCPRLARAGCFLPLSVRFWRLRRPPTFHGREGVAHRLGPLGGRESPAEAEREGVEKGGLR